MDTHKYIKSGVLEAYVLGLLDIDEERELEELAGKYPEVRKALRERQASLQQLAEKLRTKAGPDLGDRIIGSSFAAGEGKIYSGDTYTATNPESLPAKQDAGSFKKLAIAATIVLLLSLAINTLQYQVIRRLEVELGDTLIWLATLENENALIEANSRQLTEELKLLRESPSSLFLLKAVKGQTSDLSATVWWNPHSERVYLKVNKLPGIPTAKQYQLWAFKEGKPIDMGVFDPRATMERRKMGHIDWADAFAITLEPRGGSKKPSLAEMYVYGSNTAN